MGATLPCHTPTRACQCAEVFKERTQVKNTKVQGEGGEVVVLQGCKVWVCIVSFDYKGYGCEKHKIPPLSSCSDGERFATLARDSGAEVSSFYDRADLRSNGFPQKATILKEWSRIGNAMGPNDVFVFFYSGHGALEKTTDEQRREGKDGGKTQDDALCFVEPNGKPNYWRDHDIAQSIYKDFHPDAHLLFVTDCCHSGTVCDLSRRILVGRPIVHLSAVRDDQEAQDLGDGGAFTCSIVETVEHLLREDGDKERDFSVVHLFNSCHDRYNYRFANQDFCFEKTAHFDPDTFRWPLVPPHGWSVNDPLDSGPRLGCGM
mmetsp:Transcript_130131/g.417577  ORF Transcript_130131/g.417577 Transcript_130131/m.417577 type:complete len:318 (+) Transcript_130131:116-1069(+)